VTVVDRLAAEPVVVLGEDIYLEQFLCTVAFSNPHYVRKC